jgi:hypothetical protein
VAERQNHVDERQNHIDERQNHIDERQNHLLLCVMCGNINFNRLSARKNAANF